MNKIMDKDLNKLHELLIRMNNIAYRALSLSIDGCLNDVDEYHSIVSMSYLTCLY